MKVVLQCLGELEHACASKKRSLVESRVPIGYYFGIVQIASEDPAGGNESFRCLLCLKEWAAEAEAGKGHSLLDRLLDGAAAVDPPIDEGSEVYSGGRSGSVG
jgi:hypothetical protein